MPLVVMCGLPSSGKSRRARELATALRARGRRVLLLDEAGALAASATSKDKAYGDSHLERQLRGTLKARVLAPLDAEHTVIFDGPNYIKGFRYELYCGSKSSKTTQCTIFTIMNIDEAWKFNQNRSTNVNANNEMLSNSNSTVQDDTEYVDNEAYSKETFDALVLRFEEPISQNRWDSPLFTVQQNDELNVDQICDALYERKPPPPNLSTQNPPLSGTNFLYEIDKVTQDISNQILDNKKINPHSEMTFRAYPNCTFDANCVQSIQPGLLLRLRRQFLTFAKMQYSNHEPSQIGGLYLQYLKTNFEKSDS